jgi:acyl carrier protein
MNKKEFVIGVFSEYYKENIDIDMNIDSMNIDSIDMLEIALKIEDALNVELDLAELSNNTTLGQLIDSLPDNR